MDLYTSFTQKKREVFHHPSELLQEDDTKAAEVPEVPKVDAADAPKTDELKAGVDMSWYELMVQTSGPAPVQVGRFSPLFVGCLVHPRWLFGISEPSTVWVAGLFWTSRSLDPICVGFFHGILSAIRWDKAVTNDLWTTCIQAQLVNPTFDLAWFLEHRWLWMAMLCYALIRWSPNFPWIHSHHGGLGRQQQRLPQRHRLRLPQRHRLRHRRQQHQRWRKRCQELGQVMVSKMIS